MTAWADTLDSIAAQLALQERAVGRGYPAPTDLEIDPPIGPLGPEDRIRAIELFERCEHLLGVATERAVATRASLRSPYSRSRP